MGGLHVSFEVPAVLLWCLMFALAIAAVWLFEHPSFGLMFIVGAACFSLGFRLGDWESCERERQSADYRDRFRSHFS